MAKHDSTITTLPRSPDDDRRRRMIKYSVTMGIRLICVVMCIFVRGWWLLVFAAGAVLLPYVAVILANLVDARGATLVSPGLPQLMPTAAPPEHREEDEAGGRS